jgi:hypothetical protein
MGADGGGGHGYVYHSLHASEADKHPPAHSAGDTAHARSTPVGWPAGRVMHAQL